MIEIVCPSCQARYQLPDGSIGPEGRKVSCSSCAHKWRAYPAGQEPQAAFESDDPDPTVPSRDEPGQDEPDRESIRAALRKSAAEPEPAPEPATAPEAEPRPAAAQSDSIAESMAAIASVSAELDKDTTPPPATGSRDDQMAAIRQMLSDLKDSADVEPAPEPEAPLEEEHSPAPVVRKRAAEEHEEDDDLDPLKSRIDHLTKMNRAIKGEAGKSGYDAAKLRKLHEKRAKRFQRQRDRRKKSGGFLTGFTLVASVAAIMVGLYVMKPQIIAASPQMEPALNEYTAAIDSYRVELNAVTAEYRDWVMERIDKIRGKQQGEDAAAPASGEATGN